MPHPVTRFETLDVRSDSDVLTVGIDRVPQQNAINGTLLAEMHAVLDEAERLPDCRQVVIHGASGVFCTGMDFADATGSPQSVAERGGAEFLGLLKRLTTVPRVVVSVVDGRATGGGVGIAAASDFVVATPRAVFSLPEALWGLLPCCVLPFLIRRVGFQPAYAMGLSTLPVTAEQAHRIHLADELAPSRSISCGGCGNGCRNSTTTIGAMKRYQRDLWFLSEETERAAIAEFTRLMSSPACGSASRGSSPRRCSRGRADGERVAVPGQGAQRKGMGGELFDQFPQLVKQADEILGYSVRAQCLDGANPGLSDTRYVQPALFVVNALSQLGLGPVSVSVSGSGGGARPRFLAGHSLGEYNALFAAGCFDFETGVRIVCKRGELMGQATGGGMTAVLGLDPAKLERLLRDAGLDDLDLANRNSAQQVVLSGPLESLSRVRDVVSESGGRCVPLRVSAPFHSRYMAAAAAEFGEFLRGVRLAEPAVPVIANATGEPYPRGRWRSCSPGRSGSRCAGGRA